MIYASLLEFDRDFPDDDAECRTHIRKLLGIWVHEFKTCGNIQKRVLNHGKKNITYVPDMDGFNYMHVVAIKLCSRLNSHVLAMYNEHNIQTDVYAIAPQLQTSMCEIREMDWDQLSDLVTALQLEMPNLVYSSRNSENKLEIIVKIDLLKILVMCLKRAGFWIQNYWKKDTRATDGESEEDSECDENDENGNSGEQSKLINTAPKHACTEHGWSYVERHNIVQVLDALHALMTVTLAFYDSTIVHHENAASTSNILENMTEHHREVSLDKFYEISMISDINPGMISQYKHRHQEVFHSVSQVVYYNWPSYQRHKQKSFKEIMDKRSAVNILPLIAEMFPTVPVLYEHDGALSCEAHSKHQFSWALINTNVFLVTKTLDIYYSDDIMQLCALFNKDCGAPSSADNTNTPN